MMSRATLNCRALYDPSMDSRVWGTGCDLNVPLRMPSVSVWSLYVYTPRPIGHMRGSIHEMPYRHEVGAAGILPPNRGWNRFDRFHIPGNHAKQRQCRARRRPRLPQTALPLRGMRNVNQSKSQKYGGSYDMGSWRRPSYETEANTASLSLVVKTDLDRCPNFCLQQRPTRHLGSYSAPVERKYQTLPSSIRHGRRETPS